MEPRRLRCMLVLPGGPARRVGPAGALLGRQGDCDLVTADPRASRRHAPSRPTLTLIQLPIRRFQQILHTPPIIRKNANPNTHAQPRLFPSHAKRVLDPVRDLPRHPRVADWWAAIQARPAFAKARIEGFQDELAKT